MNTIACNNMSCFANSCDGTECKLINLRVGIIEEFQDSENTCWRPKELLSRLADVQYRELAAILCKRFDVIEPVFGIEPDEKALNNGSITVMRFQDESNAFELQFLTETGEFSIAEKKPEEKQYTVISLGENIKTVLSNFLTCAAVPAAV